MAKGQRQKGSPKKSGTSGVVKVVAIVALLAAAEDDIKVVNFQGLTPKQKDIALEAANTARCTCGCGLGLAQCVATDPNCPVREGNIDRIKGMVRSAMAEHE